MKKETEKKTFLTPDDVMGSCWLGNVMTPEETKYIEEWVKQQKARQENKKSLEKEPA